MSNVELFANVADVRPYLARSGVLAVPLRIGGGSRLKILEALAVGLPVVSTAVGAEGLDLGAESLLVVPEPEGMADALLRYIRDPELARSHAELGRAAVLESYDWDLLAAGVVVGHLLECSGQVAGGNYSGSWWENPDPLRIAFPIAEVEADGTAVITKPAAAGGMVTFDTVREQLLYEVHDPSHYFSPDVVADFTSLPGSSEMSHANPRASRRARRAARPCAAGRRACPEQRRGSRRPPAPPRDRSPPTLRWDRSPSPVRVRRGRRPSPLRAARPAPWSRRPSRTRCPSPPGRAQATTRRARRSRIATARRWP